MKFRGRINPPPKGEGDRPQDGGGASPRRACSSVFNRATPPSGLRPGTSPFRGGSRAIALALTLALAACGSTPDRPRTPSKPSKPEKPRGPVTDTAPRVGKPYQVGGVWYVPADVTNYDEVGLASWYGPNFHGAATANGEYYDMDWVSAAHKTLPLPSYVEVTALDTGRTILVRVNDRGPFVADRIIDLSRGAAHQLGIDRAGVARVRVRRVYPGEGDKLALRSGRAASPRSAPPPVQLASLRRDLVEKPRPPLVRTPAPEAPGRLAGLEGIISQARVSEIDAPGAPATTARSWYVQVAALSDQARAQSLADGLNAIGRTRVDLTGAIWRVRIGPYGDEASALAALARAKAGGYQEARLVTDLRPPA
jgi:rare lipoprotein A